MFEDLFDGLIEGRERKQRDRRNEDNDEQDRRQGHFCPECGTAVRDGAKFCEGCGKPLQSVRPGACTQCGVRLAGSPKFCPSCGARVAESVG